MTMPAIAIRDANALAQTLLPAMAYQDRNILIAIAAAQVEGVCLSMKQLVLSQAGTSTTIRRRVARLIRLGHVLTELNDQDGRSHALSVSKAILNILANLAEDLKQVMVAFQAREAARAKSSRAKSK